METKIMRAPSTLAAGCAQCTTYGQGLPAPGAATRNDLEVQKVVGRTARPLPSNNAVS